MSDILRRAREVSAEAIVDQIEAMGQGRKAFRDSRGRFAKIVDRFDPCPPSQCRIKGCDNDATMYDGTCEVCYEDLKSMEEYEGRLTVQDDGLNRTDKRRMALSLGLMVLTCVLIYLWAAGR